MLPCIDLPFVPISFLQKIYQILATPALHTIISWHTDGALFMVKSIPDLCEQVLPVYFKHGNYASFVRQLNMYDFHKVKEGEWENAFRHPLFLRDRPDLLPSIKRKSCEARDPMAGAIVPIGLLSRTETDELMQKISSFDAKQSELMAHITTLEDRNAGALERNRNLVRSICNYRAREQQMEQLLLVLASYIESTGRNKELESAVEALVGERADSSELQALEDYTDATVKKPKLSSDNKSESSELALSPTSDPW